MNKEQYFDMCDALGAEPIESEIPVELEDLPYEAQLAWEMYHMLPSNYDSYSGKFLGKHLEYASSFFELLDVDENRHTIFKILMSINSIVLDVSSAPTSTPKK